MKYPLEMPEVVKKIVMLEDHPLFLEGLKISFQKNFPELKVLYAGADVREAQNIVKEEKVDLALVDLHLGDGRSPGEIVAVFSSAGIPVLVISALSNFESVKSAHAMGARGLIGKDSGTEELIRAVRAVLSGNEWISPVLDRALNFHGKTSDELSVQEKKALILYGSGLQLDLVAKRMNVAPSTVKQYIERAKAKYLAAGKPIRTKTEMYRALRDEGLIQ